MIDRGSVPSADFYSPQRRTALLLSGTGTAGAYHAGVLRALHEAGVKLDVVAGRGVGVVGALFSAVDGAHRLWDEKGVWRASQLRNLYQWRAPLRLAAWTLTAAVALVVAPLATMAIGLVVYPIDFLLKMVGASGAGGLTGWYLGVAEAAFAPNGLPTWVPRLVLLVLGLAASVAVVAGVWRGTVRQPRGSSWWRLAQPPLSSDSAIDHCWRMLWDLVRGATPLKQPTRADLARRYAEMLADNLGQPGFRELMLVAHDLDAGCDLVFALVAESRRRDLHRPVRPEDGERRRAEVIDLAGAGRDHLADAVAAALSVPLATDIHLIQFAPEAFWRGEEHRLSDRPGSLERLIQELVALDVDQVVLVSAAPEAGGPHTLAAPRLDGRGRVGEYLQSSESAAVRDVLMARAAGDARPRIFAIRPTHNPVGPLDFDGGFDDRSGRRSNLTELMLRGYDDAYRQFIEPVVGASGERVGRAEA
jgi:hypothetical protein